MEDRSELTKMIGTERADCLVVMATEIAVSADPDPKRDRTEVLSSHIRTIRDILDDAGIEWRPAAEAAAEDRRNKRRAEAEERWGRDGRDA